MSHTPGPWHFNGRSRAVYAGLQSVANCSSNAVGDSSDANCRLIAAAPDLLAALKAMMPANEAARRLMLTIGMTDNLIIPARAAIAKAEGGGT